MGEIFNLDDMIKKRNERIQKGRKFISKTI